MVCLGFIQPVAGKAEDHETLGEVGLISGYRKMGKC